MLFLEQYRNFRISHVLMKLYPAEEVPVRIAIAEFLEKREELKAGSFLLDQLKKEKTINVKEALIKALGVCGAISAVQPLLEIRNPLLALEARKAVVPIQSRMGPKGKGWLSVAAPASGGELSFSGGDDRGSLSLKD